MINNDMIGKDVYSLNKEVKTNKIWIDGKPIYRKVIQATDLSVNKDLNILVDNDIDIFIYADGIYIDSAGRYVPGNLYNQANATYNTVTFGWNKRVYYRVWFACVKIFLIVEYTKTTD